MLFVFRRCECITIVCLSQQLLTQRRHMTSADTGSALCNNNVLFTLVIITVQLTHTCTHVSLQITYTPDVIVSTDASVSGRFQLYPSERDLVSALLAVVEEYNWTQISVLTQNEQPFIRVSIVMDSEQHYVWTAKR